VARFFVARFFVARFFVARFFVARFFVARFFVARFFVARFFTPPLRTVTNFPLSKTNVVFGMMLLYRFLHWSTTSSAHCA
jgi:hypothetical protein